MSAKISLRARVYVAFSLALIALLLLAIVSYPDASRAIIIGGLAGFALLGANFYLFNNLVLERQRADTALRKSNETLTASVRALERTADEIRLLGEVAGVLRSCLTLDEVAKAVARFSRELFPRDSGGLYVVSDSTNLFEAVAVWGENPPEERAFAFNDCWALRRGTMHRVEDLLGGVVCRHFSHASESSYFCLPLAAREVTLGLLHLTSSSPHPVPGEHPLAGGNEIKERIARTFAQQIALALAGLKHLEAIGQNLPAEPDLLPTR